MEKPSLRGTPLLVLGNKNDLPGALQAKALIEKLNLKVWTVVGRERQGRRGGERGIGGGE